MASGHVNRENRPNTWLHPTGICDVKIFLANSEPSTHGPSQTSEICLLWSADVVKADVVSLTSEGSKADTVDKVGDEPDEALDWSPLRSFLRTYSVNLRQLCVS